MADKAHTVHDNLLKRQFVPATPNQVWVSDVAYIHTKALTVAYALSQQVCYFIQIKPLLHHRTFADAVARCHMTHSMSTKGNYQDNAPTERLFRSFKTEWMPKHGYENIHEANTDAASYILGYYSQIRPHSFNNYPTKPCQKERQFFNKTLLEVV